MTRLRERLQTEFHPGLLFTGVGGGWQENVPLTFVVGTGSPSGRAVRQVLYEIHVAPLMLEPAPADLITMIRQYLSLSVSDFARIAGIERPTVYAWIDGDSTPRKANLERLRALSAVAERWKAMTGRPMGRLLHERVPGETMTLAEVLAGEIDAEAVASLLERLALRGHEREPLSVKERITLTGLSDKSETSQRRGFMRTLRTRARRARRR